MYGSNYFQGVLAIDYKVIKKQQNSRLCLVCGLQNQLGLKAEFYELENEELVAIFDPLEEHQSYPGRLHGGVAGAILDETIGRAIMIQRPDVWGVTVELALRYHAPIPLDQRLRVRGRITRDASRIFEGCGEILLPDDTVAVRAIGKYMKMPLEKIADWDTTGDEWQVVNQAEDPAFIALPELKELDELSERE